MLSILKINSIRLSLLLITLKSKNSGNIKKRLKIIYKKITKLVK